MPLEIEIKLKLDSHAPILETLRTLKATHLGPARETNIFFDRPDKSLRAADYGLRVRLATNTPQALLTFKGPAAKTGLHAREAFDLTCTPADQLIPLLNALGFHQTFLFEKDRDSWLLHDCHIELDILPHFGSFLEIEGPSEPSVRTTQSQLHLQNLPPVTTSYSKMVAEFLQQQLARAGALRF